MEKGASAKTLCIDRTGTSLLLNCNDRTIRLYTLSKDGQLTLTYRFKDLVNNIHWARALFSPDGEHLIAAAANRSKHTIYIYDRHMGNLIKLLEGPSEGLDEFDVSPFLLFYFFSCDKKIAHATELVYPHSGIRIDRSSRPSPRLVVS